MFKKYGGEEIKIDNEDYKNDKDPQLDKAIEIMLEKIKQK
jgi:hypothetical protein